MPLQNEAAFLFKCPCFLVRLLRRVLKEMIDEDHLPQTNFF